MIQGIPGIANISDAVIVHSATREERDKRLKLVLGKLQRVGLTECRKVPAQGFRAGVCGSQAEE